MKTIDLALWAAFTAASLSPLIPMPQATAADYGSTFSTGDSYGPHGKHAYTDGYAAYSRSVKSPAKPAVKWADQPWSYQGTSAYGYVDPRPGDLAENRARNERHARRSYEQLIENGGCNAPVVPVEYAIGCGTSYGMRNAFGGAQNNQMGSEGGE